MKGGERRPFPWHGYEGDPKLERLGEDARVQADEEIRGWSVLLALYKIVTVLWILRIQYSSLFSWDRKRREKQD